MRPPGLTFLFVSVYWYLGEKCFRREPLSASLCVKECCGFSALFRLQAAAGQWQFWVRPRSAE